MSLSRRTALASGIAALTCASPVAAREKLHRRELSFAGRRISYLVRRAKTAPDRPAPMLLCFGGGDANEGIARYYDQVYTPGSLYQDHHVILPIGPRRSLYFQFEDSDITAMLDALSEAEPIAGRSLLSGVSNGGRAAFRFAQAAPDAFRGIVTIPGALVQRRVPEAWRDYAILLAYGGNDPGWQTQSEEAFEILNGKVGAIELLELPQQGHVVGPDYNTDPIYARLQKLEAQLGR